MAGLSSNKANYKMIVDSVQNPGEHGAVPPVIAPTHRSHARGTHSRLCIQCSVHLSVLVFTGSMCLCVCVCEAERKLVPTALSPSVPSILVGEPKPAQSSPHLSPLQPSVQTFHFSQTLHKPVWVRNVHRLSLECINDAVFFMLVGHVDCRLHERHGSIASRYIEMKPKYFRHVPPSLPESYICPECGWMSLILR